MSDTPRTDVIYTEYSTAMPNALMVLATFARTLERELAAAKAEVSRLTENQLLQDSATAAVMERAEKAEAELTACREAVIAMAEDGYLLFGPEGMDEAQKKLLAAYECLKG